MKLQYLGDSRDAFKWDLLHFICAHPVSQLNRLVYVPMLTPDDPNPTDGRTHHSRFPVRPELSEFIAELGRTPRSLLQITRLGRLQNDNNFPVLIWPSEAFMGKAAAREDYWMRWSARNNDHSLVFFDPDNGFETKTQRATKWVRHEELKSFLEDLPESAAIVVYQHRPRRKWADLFADLQRKLTYAPHVLEAHEASLAFVFLTKSAETAERISRLLEEYRRHHPQVLGAVIR